MLSLSSNQVCGECGEVDSNWSVCPDCGYVVCHRHKDILLRCCDDAKARSSEEEPEQ